VGVWFRQRWNVFQNWRRSVATKSRGATAVQKTRVAGVICGYLALVAFIVFGVIYLPKIFECRFASVVPTVTAPATIIPTPTSVPAIVPIPTPISTPKPVVPKPEFVGELSGVSMLDILKATFPGNVKSEGSTIFVVTGEKYKITSNESLKSYLNYLRVNPLYESKEMAAGNKAKVLQGNLEKWAPNAPFGIVASITGEWVRVLYATMDENNRIVLRAIDPVTFELFSFVPGQTIDFGYV